MYKYYLDCKCKCKLLSTAENLERLFNERSSILYGLREFSLIGRDMETKAIGGRLAKFVELCYSRAKLNRVWHIIGHLNILAKEEICLRIRSLEFTPSIGLWHK